MSSSDGTRKVLRASDPTAVGHYRLSARLGSGGMGIVYLGSDPWGGQAAVKVLRDDHHGDQALRRRFAREVVVVAAIDSPRVARLLDADPLAEQPWLATEYVPGLTLTDSVLADGPMSDDGLRALAAGVADALRAVHEAGVVHRDLKPSNIMLAADGPKIIDFGIVAGLPETVTASGIVLGSLGYIAPELLVDGGRPSPKADIFAWALTLVFASTGRSPFGDGPVEALLYRTVNTVPDLRAIRGSLRGLVAAALDKDPRRRPTASEILRQLEGTPGGPGADRPVLDAPSADAPTTDLRVRPAVGSTAAAVLGPTEGAARGDRSAESLPAWAGHPADQAETRPGPRPASRAGTGARRRRVLLPAASAAAALAVTATALVAAAPESSPGTANTQRSPLTASVAPASTVPAPADPVTTAAPVAVGTDPAGQRIGEPAASQPLSTAPDPSPSEPGSGKPRTAARPSSVGQSRGSGRPHDSKPPRGRG